MRETFTAEARAVKAPGELARSFDEEDPKVYLPSDDEDDEADKDFPSKRSGRLQRRSHAATPRGSPPWTLPDPKEENWLDATTGPVHVLFADEKEAGAEAKTLNNNSIGAQKPVVKGANAAFNGDYFATDDVQHATTGRDTADGSAGEFHHHDLDEGTRLPVIQASTREASVVITSENYVKESFEHKVDEHHEEDPALRRVVPILCKWVGGTHGVEIVDKDNSNFKKVQVVHNYSKNEDLPVDFAMEIPKQK
ncbi:hypothetical protein CYMTET_23072 [Cymbomonas tetramitiformis]|uniref:Uncharacterized protein n=1 Tax=Cymbomonas tetramitiformis TaxID=36881 RepID=A0AAE0FZ10_9CHLO|nr:hypothetical protein CYMTET_23072 [Cymbomonas tetramitiformis]